MIIAGKYSFKGGHEFVRKHYATLLEEVEDVIASADALKAKRKKSKEKTMKGKVLYSPPLLNKAFTRRFSEYGWNPVRVACDYSTKYYSEGYIPALTKGGAFREEVCASSPCCGGGGNQCFFEWAGIADNWSCPSRASLTTATPWAAPRALTLFSTRERAR